MNFIQGTKRFLVTTLIGGLLVILPIGLFIWLVTLVWGLLSRIIAPIVNLIRVDFINNDFVIQLIAFALIISICFFVGLFVRTQIGKTIWINIEENILEKLPFYKTIKDTVGTLFSSRNKSFRQVVLVEVMNTQMTGFVTDQHKNGLYTIFVPTAPNPTNGFIFQMPKEKLTFLDLSPEDAMRTIIGMGTGSGIIFGEKLAHEEDS